MPSKEYMREYMLARYHRRRAEWIERLGGQCVVCQSTHKLEFDHINPTTKSFNIATTLASRSETMIAAEMSKCQLLCEDCHLKKTSSDTAAAVEHGTYWRYRKYKCRCELCTAANTKQIRIYKERWKASKNHKDQ